MSRTLNFDRSEDYVSVEDRLEAIEDFLDESVGIALINSAMQESRHYLKQ